MINNRQGGRRRGRNNSNPRANSGGNNRGGGDSANRIDNRARGNATQMLEKYKNMARDAQMQDDRVQAEYYLQFADHYFRVQNDYKQRQEEAQAEKQSQQKSRQHDDGQDDGDDNRGRRNDRNQDRGQDRNQDRGQEQAQDRNPRARNARNDDQNEDSRQSNDGDDAPRKVSKPRAKAKAPKIGTSKDDGSLDASVLPPSLSATIGASDDVKPAAKPRRTRSKPTPESDTGDSAAA